MRVVLVLECVTVSVCLCVHACVSVSVFVCVFVCKFVASRLRLLLQVLAVSIVSLRQYNRHCAVHIMLDDSAGGGKWDVSLPGIVAMGERVAVCRVQPIGGPARCGAPSGGEWTHASSRYWAPSYMQVGMWRTFAVTSFPDITPLHRSSTRLASRSTTSRFSSTWTRSCCATSRTVLPRLRLAALGWPQWTSGTGTSAGRFRQTTSIPACFALARIRKYMRRWCTQRSTTLRGLAAMRTR